MSQSKSLFPLSPSLDLHSPPKLQKLLGPSFIILGLGLGSGEIILWPYLSSNYGLGLVWAIVIGVTMQFFINMEVERHALIFGESVFVGFARWTRFLPLWFILSTFLGFGWPGIGLSGAVLFSNVFPQFSANSIGIILFLTIGLILTLGKKLYTTVETLQKYLILFGTPAILLLTVYLARGSDWQQLAYGLVGIGNNFNFFPPNLAMASFLGALAFAGAGGNLNLAQSFYVRDKGYGMGKYSSQIKSLITDPKADTNIPLAGRTFPITTQNISRFRKWWRLVNIEHFLVFWGLGLVTMLTLSLLAYVTSFGHPGNPDGINFVITQAKYIGQQTAPVMSVVFLVVTGLMLTATQLTVLDSTSRIITENILLARKKAVAHVSRYYYAILWFQILFGILVFSLGFNQPRELLTLSAVINAFTMFVYSALLFYLNNYRLHPALRPGLLRNLALVFTFLFFGFFCFQTLL